MHDCAVGGPVFKWNKIEHRVFSCITMNRSGRPLVSHAVIINLIGRRRTRRGLKVRAELDNANCPEGLVVSDEDFAAITIDQHEVHGGWNYCVPSGRIRLTHSLAGSYVGTLPNRSVHSVATPCRSPEDRMSTTDSSSHRHHLRSFTAEVP